METPELRKLHESEGGHHATGVKTKGGLGYGHLYADPEGRVWFLDDQQAADKQHALEKLRGGSARQA